MIKPGTLLQDRYRVIQQVGKGGMGEVYLATDERFQSRVAIKRAFFDDPEMCKAFKREARLLNHLKHSALPKVSDHFSEGDGQLLVMEFIEGFDFAELLARRKVPFPLSDVLRWADELLDALDYLHTHEPPVVHRDIKPPNIKLTPKGKVMLLDFGLAKGAPTQTTSATASSVFGYSLNFAPLEQMQGSGTDPRSDLYSLAATLYSLLTGVRPPDALTRASAAIKEHPDPLRPAHLVQPQVPAAVGQILQRAMSQNAALRHGSAAELRAALRHAAASQAIPAFDSLSPSSLASVSPQSEAASEVGEPVASDVQSQRSRGQGSQERSQPSLSSQSLRPSLLSTGDAATALDAPRRPRFSDSYTVAARAASTSSGTANKKFGLAACLLIVCVAAGAYLFARASGSSAPAAVANSESQTSPPPSQQIDPGGTKVPATSVVTSDSLSATPDTNGQAQSSPTLKPSETTTVSDSRTNASSGTPGTEEQTTKQSGAVTDGASLGSGASSATAPALVIQNPAPAPKPLDETRRAEETRQAQPVYRPDYNDGPPPGMPYPPPPDGRRPPPPPDGRRPPPNFGPPRP